MPGKKIIFLEKTYNTQKEFENYVKNLIYKDIGICNDIKNRKPYLYNNLIELLKRHPEYISKSKDMINIKIQQNNLNKKGYEILIINNDNSEIDISWRTAITGSNKSKKRDLTSAMRYSIKNQILEYKNKQNNYICVKCHSNQNIEVDHNDELNLSFDELTKNFIDIMKRKNINIPDIFTETNDDAHRITFLEKDYNFKNEWIKYHYENASLRLLCKTCNNSRPKTKNKLIL